MMKKLLCVLLLLAVLTCYFGFGNRYDFFDTVDSVRKVINILPSFLDSSSRVFMSLFGGDVESGLSGDSDVIVLRAYWDDLYYADFIMTSTLASFCYSNYPAALRFRDSLFFGLSPACLIEEETDLKVINLGNIDKVANFYRWTLCDSEFFYVKYSHYYANIRFNIDYIADPSEYFPPGAYDSLVGS